MRGVRTLDLAQAFGPELIALRRALHQVPELGLHLPLTQQAVLDALAGLDLEVTVGEGLSSVVAVLRGRGGESGSGRRPRAMPPARGPSSCSAGTWTPCP